MTPEIRRNIIEARKRLKHLTRLAYGTSNHFAYNLAMKAYLKGVYEALRAVKNEVE